MRNVNIAVTRGQLTLILVTNNLHHYNEMQNPGSSERQNIMEITKELKEKLLKANSEEEVKALLGDLYEIPYTRTHKIAKRKYRGDTDSWEH